MHTHAAITRQKSLKKKSPYFNLDCPKKMPQNRKLPINRFKYHFELSTTTHRDATAELNKRTSDQTELGKK